MTLVGILFGMTSLISVTTFSTSFMLINNSCSNDDRGAVNGLAMTVASITKALGPVIDLWATRNELEERSPELKWIKAVTDTPRGSWFRAKIHYGFRENMRVDTCYSACAHEFNLKELQRTCKMRVQDRNRTLHVDDFRKNSACASDGKQTFR